jgi:phosphomannomutase
LAESDITDQIIDLAAECATDPVRWVAAAYDWGVGELAAHQGPRAWQDDILGEIRDHLSNPETRCQPLQIAVSSGHGIGKSALIGMLANWGISTSEYCKVVCTANTDTHF